MKELLILLFMGSLSVRATPLLDQTNAKSLTEITEAVTSASKIYNIDEAVEKLVGSIKPEIPGVKNNTSDPLEYKQALRHKPEFHIIKTYNNKTKLAEGLTDTDKDILATVIRDYIRSQKDKHKQQSAYNKQEEEQLNNEEYEDRLEGNVFSEMAPSVTEMFVQFISTAKWFRRLLEMSQQTVNEELSYYPVPRPFSKSRRNTEDDMSNNINGETDREYANAGLNDATNGFEVQHDKNKTSIEENTDEDSEEYYDDELSDNEIKLIEQVKADLDKLWKTRISKIVKLNDILNVIKDSLARAVTLPPACWERSLKYLMKDINATYALYLLNSECYNLFETKKKRFDVKNREDVETLLRGSVTYKHNLKPNKYWSSSALIDELTADDIFYKDMFEIYLPIYETNNTEKKVIKKNKELKRYNCENVASEQLLLAIEIALVRFLLYPRCKQIEFDVIDKKESNVKELTPFGKTEYLDNISNQTNGEAMQSLSSEESSKIDKGSSVNVNIDDINHNEKNNDTTTLNSNNVTLEDEDYESDYIFKDTPDVMVLTFKNEVIAIPVFDVVLRKESASSNRGTVKKIKGIFKGLKSPFKMNSVTKIKRKLYALCLSNYNKVVKLAVVEKILEAFFVKLPPVLKKVLDDLKPLLEKKVDKKITVKDLLTIIKEGFVNRKSNSTGLSKSDNLKRKEDAFQDLTKYRASLLVGDTNDSKMLADFEKVKENVDMAWNKNQIDKSNFNSDPINLGKAYKQTYNLLNAYKEHDKFHTFRDTNDDNEPYAKVEYLNPENEYHAKANMEANTSNHSKMTVSNKTDLLLHSTKYKNNTRKLKGPKSKLNAYEKSKSRRQRTSILPNLKEEIEDDNDDFDISTSRELPNEDYNGAQIK